MTQQSTILEYVASASGPICDDCLSDRTGISPRQTIYANCTRLATANKIVRGPSLVCDYCRKSKICSHLGKNSAGIAVRPAKIVETDNPHELWHWEGNVQSALVTWLAKEGWSIRSAADTAAKTSGKDIVAERDGKELWISVKGYPRNTPKTNASTQARHWFSGVLFDLVLYRDESSSAELAIGMPDGFKTYHNLANRVSWLRGHLPFKIYWVSESGEVRSD